MISTAPENTFWMNKMRQFIRSNSRALNNLNLFNTFLRVYTWVVYRYRLQIHLHHEGENSPHQDRFKPISLPSGGGGGGGGNTQFFTACLTYVNHHDYNKIILQVENNSKGRKSIYVCTVLLRSLVTIKRIYYNVLISINIVILTGKLLGIAPV